MIINHNMNALNAHRNMGINNTAAGKSMEKLSSGLRINRAGDDAAGLAISEKMRETAVLYFFQELKQREIAELLHIKLSLVKYRIPSLK